MFDRFLNTLLEITDPVITLAVKKCRKTKGVKTTKSSKNKLQEKSIPLQ